MPEGAITYDPDDFMITGFVFSLQNYDSDVIGKGFLLHSLCDLSPVAKIKQASRFSFMRLMTAAAKRAAARMLLGIFSFFMEFAFPSEILSDAKMKHSMTA